MTMPENEFILGLIKYGMGADPDVSLALSELALAVHQGRGSTVTVHSLNEEKQLNRLENLLRERMVSTR